jgi:hypothetical protein
MGELESIVSKSGESEGRSAMWWAASEWAQDEQGVYCDGNGGGEA